MKAKGLFYRLVILGVGISSSAVANNQQWAFDEPSHDDFSVMGDKSQVALGIRQQSLMLNGATVFELKNSANATHHDKGFTCAVWVNPYAAGKGQQQMIVAKNRYSLNEREWGVMIDKDGRYRLYVWRENWKTLASDILPAIGKWQHVAVSISDKIATMSVNGRSAGMIKLDQSISKTKAPLTFGGVNDNGRVWQNLCGALDEAMLIDRALNGDEIVGLYEKSRSLAEAAEDHPIPGTKIYELWSGPSLSDSPLDVPFAQEIEHQTLLDARTHDYKFLHGAAIIEHKGTFFANWANSPKNENQQFETLQGKRSADGGKSWSEVEVIGPGFEGAERHSHGVYLRHEGELWTFAARFGVGPKARRFPGLCAEAFILNEKSDRWESKGIVMKNCWPYDEPVKMEDGNYITGGQDMDGLPVVAISRGNDLTQWDSILIPYPLKLKPSFAETTVWAEGRKVIAIIRGGMGVAWVATSEDYGRTWNRAQPSNLPMPRSKAYFGRLSTGQLYLISNFKNRDTLVVSVGKPGEMTLSSMWRLRHGKSEPPRFPGAAKSKQWSYPYGFEHDGLLHVVYSIGKEDCGLTTISLSSLKTD